MFMPWAAHNLMYWSQNLFIWTSSKNNLFHDKPDIKSQPKQYNNLFHQRCLSQNAPAQPFALGIQPLGTKFIQQNSHISSKGLRLQQGWKKMTYCIQKLMLLSSEHIFLELPITKQNYLDCQNKHASANHRPHRLLENSSISLVAFFVNSFPLSTPQKEINVLS